MLFFTPLVVASLAGLSTALPLAPELTPREVQSQDIAKRQNEAAQALGLGDPDILQLFVHFVYPLAIRKDNANTS